jgi:hypothetical protein
MTVMGMLTTKTPFQDSYGLLFVGMWGPTIPPVSTAVGDELVVTIESLCPTFPIEIEQKFRLVGITDCR